MSRLPTEPVTVQTPLAYVQPIQVTAELILVQAPPPPPVSYTHLDVYKRQLVAHGCSEM